MYAHPPLDPIRFTRELVEIESTTYHEGAVGDFLAEFSRRARLAGGEDPCSAAPRERALPARAGMSMPASPDQTPDLVFSTHMDTVPPYIPFSEDTEFMYGRGVSDAKGIIAAQVAAAEALRAEGFKVGLLFVSGEERDSAGARIANESPKGSRFLINGEPTDNRLALASKGALRAVVQIHRQDGPFRLSRTRRQRRSQTGSGAGEGAGPSTARARRHRSQHPEHRPDSRRPRPQRDRRQGRGPGAGAHGD